MILGVWIAFISLNQLNLTNWLNAPFVGLQNFVNGLNPESTIGQAFFSTVGRTMLYTVTVVGFSWILGMAGAVFLSSNFKGRAILRTFFLVPYALPAYVGTIAWAFMFNQRDGAVNQILVDTLHLFGDERPFWLLGGNSFGAMIMVNIWQLWPFAFLMLMAALQNVPNEVYEAAAIDGATLWQQFRTITLPMVQPANGAGDVAVDVQPVQHSLCALRCGFPQGSHPRFAIDLPELVRQLEFRPGRSHERAAAHRPVHRFHLLHPHGAA
jgi:multiple sugar transport system permease protein